MVCGHSDITVLHSHLNKFGLASIHSTMPINFHNNTKKFYKIVKKCLIWKRKFDKNNALFSKSKRSSYW